ncbi:DUF2207 domain-containing protein [Mesobacillus foraminis]|uniref:DUF2207 domain-containing protein n=1 Tax=Mesobacillus foraminis TaxID=279826 RepID=UPI001BEA40B9|nr:DUF2207 domain-containing protein [Mesobacillus foraminis]
MFIRLMKLLLFCLAASAFTFTSAAEAKSYSVDEVKIRAWIQPDGDLLVNEIFTYRFDGEYDSVRRSIHEANHNGVSQFEAYELLNPDAKLGFIDMKDLRPLSVTQEGNTYRASFPVENGTKSIFYFYELKKAVKSYQSYSDLTVPFFGTGDNHDQDLLKVTIDFVFPEELEPNSYFAYFHDREGKVQRKEASVVRFYTPGSMMYSLTETRLLFPSGIMTAQEKSKEPLPLKEVLAAEDERAEKAASKKKTIKEFQDCSPLVFRSPCLGMRLDADQAVSWKAEWRRPSRRSPSGRPAPAVPY